MSLIKIAQLTPEQEALIAVYRDKWRTIGFSTQPMDKKAAEVAIESFYRSLGRKKPQIRFFSSPDAVKTELLGNSPTEVVEQLGSPLLSLPLSLELLQFLQGQIDGFLWQYLGSQLQPMFQPLMVLSQQLAGQWSNEEIQHLSDLWSQLSEYQWEHFWEQQKQDFQAEFRQLPGGDWLLQIGDALWNSLGERLWQGIGEPITKFISQQPLIEELQEMLRELSLPFLQLGSGLGLIYGFFASSFELSSVALIDYCVTVLDCEIDQSKWLALKALLSQCGWIVPFEKTCLVCDRPVKLLLDGENRLHAEGEMAIVYDDGSGLYAYRGVILPERYGRIHPNLWKSRWLLTEFNAELRRVLIQGIGYARICQELEAIELDSWREYTLLVIDLDVDVEPIYLLKMTCPSTGYIHALRVPPDLQSAREAIRWTNWGVDPEEFSIES